MITNRFDIFWIKLRLWLKKPWPCKFGYHRIDETYMEPYEEGWKLEVHVCHRCGHHDRNPNSYAPCLGRIYPDFEYAMKQVLERKRKQKENKYIHPR